ncbi:hypothetical protein M404DRAFT_998416 [Pisolithus tinctorius Marx 270]|uniref:Uncharacterized protein n=1 Tax=Pisolithus tinctorius Marx 270 TaxID=870435 RepID=A0A0C3KBG8_PISTI|nr:hypothetical protein M404DRAFT_998416 [Pisolithus tinctorius Marx 270]
MGFHRLRRLFSLDLVRQPSITEHTLTHMPLRIVLRNYDRLVALTHLNGFTLRLCSKDAFNQYRTQCSSISCSLASDFYQVLQQFQYMYCF